MDVLMVSVLVQIHVHVTVDGLDQIVLQVVKYITHVYLLYIIQLYVIMDVLMVSVLVQIHVHVTVDGLDQHVL